VSGLVSGANVCSRGGDVVEVEGRSSICDVSESVRADSAGLS